MALRSTRLRPLQDENAPNSLLSGKNPLNERKGLQQQQGLVERKKLSNITNHVPTQAKLPGKASVEKESFSIRADSQKSSRPPLKSLSSNAASKNVDETICKAAPKQKADGKIQNPTFHLPPRSKLNLTEEMKKKAALWAAEGIESLHVSGDDMEMLRKKARDEEITKRVEMTRNYRSCIPFPRVSVPHSFTWKPLDVLEPEILNDLDDDTSADLRDMDADMHINDGLSACIEYFSVCSPPRFTEGWPQINEHV